MWRLIRKFSFMFLLYQGLYYAFLFPALKYDRIVGPDPLDLSFVLYLSSYMVWLILGSIWAHEQWEDKNRGYHFLRNLPVRRWDLVGAKFSAPLLSIALYLAVHLLWFRNILESPESLGAASANLWVTTSVCLVMAGLYILGFYRFGYRRFGKIALPLWLFLIIAPLLFRIILKEHFNIGGREIIQAVQQVNPTLVMCAGLAVYLGAFWLALQWKWPSPVQGD